MTINNTKNSSHILPQKFSFCKNKNQNEPQKRNERQVFRYRDGWWQAGQADLMIDDLQKKGRKEIILISMMWRWWVLVMLTDLIIFFWTTFDLSVQDPNNQNVRNLESGKLNIWSIVYLFIHGGLNIKVLRRIDGWWCGGGGLFGGGSDEQVLVVVAIVDLLNNCTTIWFWTNDEILAVVVAVEISLAAMHNMKLESSWWW